MIGRDMSNRAPALSASSIAKSRRRESIRSLGAIGRGLVPGGASKGGAVTPETAPATGSHRSVTTQAAFW